MKPNTFKTYTLDEIEDGIFQFEGKKERITSKELSALQQMQPDRLWILFVQPETAKKLMIERKQNQSENEN